MNLRPLIEREMRVMARRVTTYYVRLVPAGLLLTLTAFWLLAGSQLPMSKLGAQLFGTLNACVFTVIWILVPFSVADTLSKEKRDNTLGLLLLTPLRPPEVVLSKVVTALVEGGALVVAGLPILAIPILMGGVNGLDLARATLLNLAALIGAISVGILASSRCERRTRAWLVAIGFTLFWGAMQLSFHAALCGGTYLMSSGNTSAIKEVTKNPGILLLLPVGGWLLSTGVAGIWQQTNLTSTTLNVGAAGVVLFVTFLFGIIAIWLASRRVRAFGESGILSARQEKVQTVFVKERLFTGRLRKRRRRLLSSNPILWVLQKRWSARLVKWGWLALAVGVFSLLSFDRERGFWETSMTAALWLGFFLLISLLVTSSSSLQGDRDSGAMELVMVTPLPPRTFVIGRLSSTWRNYLPAAILIAFTYWWFYRIWADRNFGFRHADLFEHFLVGYFPHLIFFAHLLALPIIGLSFSLHRPGILSAALNTLFFSVILPWGVPVALTGMGSLAHFTVHTPLRLSWAHPLTWLLVGISIIASLQTVIFVQSSRGMLRHFPVAWPGWLARLKIGWWLPWAISGGSFAFIELGGTRLFRNIPYDDEWLFIIWQTTALSLLLFFGSCAWRGLINQLTHRSFAQGTSCD